MSIKKKLIKFGETIKVIAGSRKGFIGKIIGLVINKKLVTISPFFNYNLLKNNSFQKIENLYGAYNEKNPLYNQKLFISLPFEKKKYYIEKKVFLDHILNIRKKNNTTTTYSFKNCFVLDFSNIMLFKKKADLILDLKIFLKLINVIK